MNPNKPLFSSITTAPRPVQESRAPQSAQAQPTTTTERLYHYRPEEIYISSVLPTRTPREVRHFQTNCWNILQENHGPCSFAHNLDDVRKITANPLDFQGLLLRASVNVGPTEINEFYYRIKRSTRPGHRDRPYLEPVYRVSYPYVGVRWSVFQFDNPLPPTPRE